jgi:hypothetical protein
MKISLTKIMYVGVSWIYPAQDSAKRHAALNAAMNFREIKKIVYYLNDYEGTRGSVVVKALCYKPEDCGFDTRRGDFFLNSANTSGRTRPWSLLSL